MVERAVLFVPSPEYRDALLREGPCGARPPRAWAPHGRWKPTDHIIHRKLSDPALLWPHALVLAWAGTPLAEGMNRAREVLARIEGFDPQHGAIFTAQGGEACLTTSDRVRDYPDAATRDALAHGPDEPEALARILEARGAGTCVIVGGERG